MIGNRTIVRKIGWCLVLLDLPGLTCHGDERTDASRVSHLIQQLDSEIPEVQERACEALGEMGADAKIAVPEIAALLGSNSLSVRLLACQALGKIGPDASSAVPKLMTLLDSENPGVRGQACETLAAIGPEAKQAVSKLTTLLTDDQPAGLDSSPASVGYLAYATLEAINSESVTALTQLVETGDPESARQAVATLQGIGIKAAPALPSLVKRLNDEDVELRRQLVTAIAEVDQSGTVAIPTLIRHLHDDDAGIRAGAAAALGRFESKSTPAVVDLLTLLDDPAPEVRGNAATSLGLIGTNPDDVVPALTALLQDQEGYNYAISNHLFGWQPVSGNAATALAAFARNESVDDLIAAIRRSNAPSHREMLSALASFGHASEKTIPVFLEHFREETAITAMALAELGPSAASAVPALRVFFEAQDEDLRTAAAVALVGIDMENHDDAFRFVLNKLADDKDLWGQNCVTDVLALLGPQAAPAVPALVENIEKEYFLDWSILRTLAKIGPAAAPAGPVLVGHVGDLLDHEEIAGALVGIGPAMIPLLLQVLNDEVRSSEAHTGAADVLGRFGPQAVIAVPHLIRRLSDPSPHVRQAAAKALGKIGEHPEQSVPALVDLLDDARPAVRAEAANSLGQFHADAKAAVPALTQTLNDEYIDVRANAVQTLGKLGTIAEPVLPAIRKLLADPNPFVAASAKTALTAIQESK